MDEDEVLRAAARRLGMKKYGERPKPRLLIAGYEESFADAVSDVFPTTRVLKSTWGEVDQTEYDAVVGLGHLGGSADHLCTLAMHGCGISPHLESNAVKYVPPLMYSGGDRASVSKEFYVPSELPDVVRESIERRLLPVLSQRESNPTLQWDVASLSFARVQSLPSVRPVIEPFVETPSGSILAGRFERKGGDSECWVVPEDDPEAAEAWLRVAVEVWRERWPSRFPLSVKWRTSPDWRTPAENKLVEKLEKLRSERATFLKKLGSAEAELQAKLAAISAEADVAERKLLTESGAALTSAVGRCLQDFGFNVEDADATATKGDLLEDLRVEDATADGWVALVEVKGYAGGANVTDLGRFTRLTRRFMAREDREPDALWYVVNQFRRQNPSDREPILRANEPELQAFATADSGLAVDTADLFRLRKAVIQGVVSADEARRLLRESSGRFTYPEP